MNIRTTLIFLLTIILSSGLKGQTSDNIINNRLPLKPNPYIQMQLGAIRPEGWLKEMLHRQKEGATGNLDILYPLVMGKRNGWLGGDGDQWERGPYWIDGLLPLAYILDDTALIEKVRPWVEWAIESQQPNGYFGPSIDYKNEPGLQRRDSHDWWPKMVMLKILKQYYSATGDERVIKLMTSYFRYQLKELPKSPLDHWTSWAKYRAGDNLMVVYWLYNITGDKFLLDLGDLLHKQSFDFTTEFASGEMLSKMGSIHTVNLAQGMKEPLVYSQYRPMERYIKATRKGFADLRKYNGMAHGLYGGDETLHGNDPTQGSELCAAVEMMFTLETSLEITGDVAYADQLEKIAFNALPAQISDDFMTRQYFQQANQVMVTKQTRNFSDNHGGSDVNFGLLSGYPCCTSNMHQGWPKFTQNLWYATADNGLAALVYAPSELKTKVAAGNEIVFTEETNYPFDESIRFNLKTDKPVTFPFHLRIPDWCRKATIKINGIVFKEAAGNQIIKINRQWKSGDQVELILPMHIFNNQWFQNSISVERGPITYALKMKEEIKEVINEKDSISYGKSSYEITSESHWNFGLKDISPDKRADYYKVNITGRMTNFPWNLENAPVEITTKAKRIPSWKLYNEMAGILPFYKTYGLETGEEEEIVLVPYGCTMLRISQFPVIR